MSLSRPVSILATWYDLFVKIVSNLQSPFLLFLRIVMGYQFIISGWGKLHNLSQITGFFTSLHLPFPAFTAVFVSNVELFGGIFLLLGLFSRLTCLVLSINMLVAYLTADFENFTSWDFDKFTKADPFTFLFVALLVLIFGPGLFSIDWLLGKWVARKRLE